MRYCEYCGAPLEDGQTCTCHQAQPSTTQPEAEPVPAPPTPAEPQGYSYGLAQDTQQNEAENLPEENSNPQPQEGNAPSGYRYQQSGADGQSSGYQYQQPGANGYGYQHQPGGYGTQNQGQPGGQTSQQFAQMGKQVRDTTVHAAKSLKPFFAQYWDSPVQAVRTAVAEKNLTVAVTMSVIRVVVVIALLWNMVGQVAGMLRSSLGGFSSLGNLLGTELVLTVRGNPLGSILFGLIIGVVGMALFTLMLFALSRIFKSDSSLLDVYIANSVNGGVTTVVLLVAYVCAFFSLNLALGLVVLACLTAVVLGTLSAQAVCGEQSSGRFWLCYLLGMLLVLALNWWVVQPCVMQTLSGITLSLNGETITLGQFLERLLSNGVTNFFSNLLY